MKYSFKIVLSYIYDVLIEKVSSPFNPILKLYLSRGQYKLVTTGAVYSFGKYYYNFSKSFEILKVDKREIKKVLILGLGMGSIIQILEQSFNVTAQFDAVEIDPEIIKLYNKYKIPYLHSNCNVINKDAISFLKDNNNKYDLICMDIFCDRRVPTEFETFEFLSSIKKALNKYGLILYNRLAIDQNDKIINQNFINTFQLVFPEASNIKLDYNWMLVNIPKV